MYTKGNWCANSGIIYVEETDASVCYVASYGEDNEAEANARLIAAAPDLLESLEELLSHLGPTGYIATCGKPATDKARAAIAKAKY